MFAHRGSGAWSSHTHTYLNTMTTFTNATYATRYPAGAQGQRSRSTSSSSSPSRWRAAPAVHCRLFQCSAPRCVQCESRGYFSFPPRCYGPSSQSGCGSSYRGGTSATVSSMSGGFGHAAGSCGARRTDRMRANVPTAFQPSQALFQSVSCSH